MRLFLFYKNLEQVINMAKVKKWHGIEELVDKEINIPKELWKFEEIMREIPNFDKADSANKIFEKDEYIILKVKKDEKR